MATDYNGWSNYETWAVNLWMDNEQASQTYWSDRARELWTVVNRAPQVLTPSEQARYYLSGLMKAEHEEGIPEFESSVYSDLLNAALGEVDWIEIADAWLENAELDGYVARGKVGK